MKDLFSVNPPKQSEKETAMPGTDHPREDIGKKVFERTGHLREGVGQSSAKKTEDVPDVQEKREETKKENSKKIHSGIRKRKNAVSSSEEPRTSSTKTNSSVKKEFKRRPKFRHKNPK